MPRTEVPKGGFRFLRNLSPQLLEDLDARFPERCPSTSTPDREIWVEVGMRKLIDIMKNEYKSQTKA